MAAMATAAIFKIKDISAGLTDEQLHDGVPAQSYDAPAKTLARLLRSWGRNILAGKMLGSRRFPTPGQNAAATCGEVAGVLLALAVTACSLQPAKACNFPCIDEVWTSVTIGLQTARRL
jgi:hypothetical protein